MTISRWKMACALVFSLGAMSCTTLDNPVVDGILVGDFPPDSPPDRLGYVPVPLTYLRQRPIDVHLVGPNDVLGIEIAHVLGGNPPPQFAPKCPSELSQASDTHYPILVQDNGTIVLPFIEPLKVENMTLAQVEEALRKAYTTDKKMLKPGEPISVTLLQPRTYHIVVLREDDDIPAPASGCPFPTAKKKNASFKLDLPVGENDVLNAIARSGGLPGTKAKNEVTIYKKGKIEGEERLIRIPLRFKPDEPVPFKPEDVILDDGDVVCLEPHDDQVFYTAGLLGSNAYPLPRDYDLDVQSAIVFMMPPIPQGAFGEARFIVLKKQLELLKYPNFVTVLRKTSTGRQLPIRVCLERPILDPRDRIIIQPGDILVLEANKD